MANTGSTQVIIIYSKYSPYCKPILDIIGEIDDTRVKFVCIDNKVTRKEILSSKTIRIRSVPCIILKHQNGEVEKFEGDNVSNWIQTNLKTKPKYTKISGFTQEPETPVVEQYNTPININAQPQRQNTGAIGDRPPFDVRGGIEPYVSATTSKESAVDIARRTELERKSMESNIKAVTPYDSQQQTDLRPQIPQMNQPPQLQFQHFFLLLNQ